MRVCVCVCAKPEVRIASSTAPWQQGHELLLSFSWVHIIWIGNPWQPAPMVAAAKIWVLQSDAACTDWCRLVSPVVKGRIFREISICPRIDGTPIHHNTPHCWNRETKEIDRKLGCQWVASLWKCPGGHFFGHQHRICGVVEHMYCNLALEDLAREVSHHGRLRNASHQGENHWLDAWWLEDQGHSIFLLLEPWQIFKHSEALFGRWRCYIEMFSLLSSEMWSHSTTVCYSSLAFRPRTLTLFATWSAVQLSACAVLNYGSQMKSVWLSQ